MVKKMLLPLLFLFIFQGFADAGTITLKAVRKDRVRLYDNDLKKNDVLEGKELNQFKSWIDAGKVSVIDSKPPYLHIKTDSGHIYWVKRNDFVTTKSTNVSINKDEINKITDKKPGSGSMGADEL